MNHLMVIKIAYHTQIDLVMESLKKAERTLSLTKKMEDSKLVSLRYGKSKKLNNDHI